MPQELVPTIADSRDASLQAGPMEAHRNCVRFAEQHTREEDMLDLSHELRTTLGVLTLVSGNLDLLYDRLNDEQRQKMIRDMRIHTQKMNDFLVDVLELCNSHGIVAM